MACDAERRTIVAMIVPLQRGNAGLDALRRQEDAERRTIVAMIVPALQRGSAGRDALRRQEDAVRPEWHATRSAAR
ncbi:hypothetical protein A241_07538 [Pseudomonas syringae pv. actinidiae ICMP 19094]|nr:hypothetical protein A241_07538 [Pseudomonas syringae pv. actinidiae ICMP 19094]